ncbi:MAG: CRISPR-associated protein Cas2 [Treponema sp.]|nr:CRISPR-associated protein Cas2 [Treponema sp.]MBQ1870280.1 CRISPR-associated protein Cas2 [Treponema sp.]MBQ2465034.1 CRISPR-associated protein Cas2 [Treponema sp.]
MFVSIVLEPGSIDSARNIFNLLGHTGFKQIQKSCWENASLSDADLTSLKKEMDRYTDYYDNIRIYQFPLEGKFVITELKEKKWRRLVLNSAQPKSAAQKVSPASAARRSAVAAKPAARPAAARPAAASSRLKTQR